MQVQIVHPQFNTVDQLTKQDLINPNNHCAKLNVSQSGLQNGQQQSTFQTNTLNGLNKQQLTNLIKIYQALNVEMQFGFGFGRSNSMSNHPMGNQTYSNLNCNGQLNGNNLSNSLDNNLNGQTDQLTNDESKDESDIKTLMFDMNDILFAETVYRCPACQ